MVNRSRITPVNVCAILHLLHHRHDKKSRMQQTTVRGFYDRLTELTGVLLCLVSDLCTWRVFVVFCLFCFVYLFFVCFCRFFALLLFGFFVVFFGFFLGGGGGGEGGVDNTRNCWLLNVPATLR